MVEKLFTFILNMTQQYVHVCSKLHNMIKEDCPFKTKTNDLFVFSETPKESYKHDHLFGIVTQEQNK